MGNKRITTFLALSLVITTAIITRGYKLGSAPAGLNSDEAGQGYSAYSILKTGKDEFGKSFPVLFRSSEDFKTPIYTYLTVPAISIFGLTPFAVRLPSAILGIFTIPVLYLLIKEITKSEKLALISAILLAISPWHILFSRTGYEVNIALFFFLAGCLFFYLSLKKAPWVLVLSALFFAVAIPAYHSQRIVTPLVLLILFIRHKKVLLSKIHFKYLIAGGLLAVVISLPTLSVIKTAGFFARASDLNILAVGKPAGFLVDYHGIFEGIINNKILLNVHELGSLYLSYFSPRFIFLLGDSGPRSSFPELGTFFIWQLPLYIYGLYLIVGKSLPSVNKNGFSEFQFFIIFFLLVSPIPASFTRDPYSSTRALQMVIPLTVLVTLAIVEVANSLKQNNLKIIYWAGFVLLIIYSLLKLYSSIIILNEHYRAVAWEYGWKPAADTIKVLNPKLPVIVDNSRNVGYIQLAFFLKADPATYQKENFEVTPAEYYTNMRANEIRKIGNITFRPINWEQDLKNEGYLIGDGLAISLGQIKEHNLDLIKEIDYPDGSVALRITKVPKSSYP